MRVTLPWFPPAPAAGPTGILSLPPDDWAMQPKIDGIRVIIYRGEPFNRLGQPLSERKGAARLRTMFVGLDKTLDGEWVPKEERFHAFDLPDETGDYDDRFKRLSQLAAFQIPGLIVLERYDARFPEVYQALSREGIEGVVFKRRSSLYAKQRRASAETRDWLKRRFAWD